jgi:hypothetical protein
MSAKKNTPACHHCGLASPSLHLTRVPARSRDGRLSTVLHLCSRCLDGEGRTWRLHWEPIYPTHSEELTYA